MAKPSIGQQLLLPKYQLGRFIGAQRWLMRRRFPGRRWLCSWLSWVMHALYGCEIAPTAAIPRSVRFPHPTGIVIGAGVTLGERVTIYQNVTLGSHGKPGVAAGYPTIGDDTTLYAGAVIVGEVAIGAGSVVGANAVVATDLPPGAVVLAAKPAIRGADAAATQD